MNERIKQLAEQATDTIEIDNPDTGITHHREFFDQVKFAESIVQECIVQIQLSTARDPQNSVQYKQSVGHIHRIREHFGVK